MKKVVFFAITSLLVACYVQDKEIAISYNNELVRIHRIALDIDKELDEEFRSEYYVLYKPGAAKVDSFLHRYKNELDSLASSLEEVEDLSSQNQMKEKLMDLLVFMRDGLVTHYTKYLDLKEAPKEKTVALLTDYKKNYDQRENAFLQAQIDLSKKFKFPLEE